MKHVIKTGEGKYVHLDSYGESYETHPLLTFVGTLFVIAIASITVGAMLGVDITNVSSPTIQRTK
jgi:hypothetical protein